MKRTSLADHPCSIARTLDVVGEWWTPLILRDVAYGVRRFREIQDDLQISANVLADRLEALVAEGILELRPYQERPPRSEYLLTEKGAELLPALLALMQWGERWKWPKGGGPLQVVHEECGSEVRVELRCSDCEREVRTNELRAKGRRRPSAVPGEHEPGNVTAARLLASADGLRIEA
ncbi:MAG: winged helix-turn-helix transcriptional regulator [Solirubrobacteraceae bacterium]